MSSEFYLITRIPKYIDDLMCAILGLYYRKIIGYR